MYLQVWQGQDDALPEVWLRHGWNEDPVNVDKKPQVRTTGTGPARRWWRRGWVRVLPADVEMSLEALVPISDVGTSEL